MSKIDLDPITSGYNLSKINANFQKVEDELNNKVLYRNPPAGEPNNMSSNLDMNSRSILNASKISSNVLELGGVQVVPTSLAVDPYNGTREALRRSYAEAGLSLVEWSFDEGGTLTSASDVLLHKSSGKAYSWSGAFPKVVAAGSVPTNIGTDWIDKSKHLLREETLSGIYELNKNFSKLNGLNLVGTFEDGCTISNSNDVALSIAEGKLYGLTSGGSITIPKASSPSGSFYQVSLNDSVILSIRSSALNIYDDDFSKIENIVSNLSIVHLIIEFDNLISITDGIGTHCSLIDTTLKSFVVKNLKISDTSTYSENFDICRIFDLSGIDYVSFENCYAISTNNDVISNDYNIGLGIVRNKNSKVFKYSGVLIQGYRPFEVWTTDLIQCDSYCKDSRYNGTFQKGCGIVHANLFGDGLRRDFYMYSCKGGYLNISGNDTYGHSPINLIVEEDGEEVCCENLTINYRLRNSRTYSTDSRQAPLYLGVQTLNNASGSAYYRNIKIIYDVEGDYGTVIDHQKLIDNYEPDTVQRGYELSNIEVTGKFTTNKRGTTRLINYKGDANWFEGDIIKRYKFTDLEINSAPGYNFVFDFEKVGNALVNNDDMLLHNVTAPYGVVVYGTDFGRKIRFTGNSILKDLTSVGAKSDSRCVVYRDDWVVIDSGQSGVNFAVLDPERSINSISLKCTAHTAPESVSSFVSFIIEGYILYNSTGVATVRTTMSKEYENAAGTVVTPKITANNTTGVINLSFPEWLDSDVKVWIETRINYTQYTNVDTDTMYGLISKKYSLTY